MPKYFLHDTEDPESYHLVFYPGDQPTTVCVSARLGEAGFDPETSVMVEVDLTQLKELVARL